MRHIRDERGDDPVAGFVRCQVLRPRGFAQPAQPSPHIELPTEGESRIHVAHTGVGARRNEFVGAAPRRSRRNGVSRYVDGRKLIRSRDPVGRPSLQYTLGSNAHLEVFLQRGGDEVRELVVMKQLEPLEVGQRCRTGRPTLGAPMHGGRLDHRTLVVGAEGARRQQGAGE